MHVTTKNSVTYLCGWTFLIKENMLFYIVLSVVARLAVGGGITDLVFSKLNYSTCLDLLFCVRLVETNFNHRMKCFTIMFNFKDHIVFFTSTAAVLEMYASCAPSSF